MNTFREAVVRATAAEYAAWFKALADPTRIQIVSLLARRGEPMSVGQIVEAVDVGQSTVSAHLKVLSDVRFVLVEQRGTARYYRINQNCVSCFPSAADVVMGSPVPIPPGAADCTPQADDQRGGLRGRIVERYSGLARMALTGGTPVDACDPESNACGTESNACGTEGDPCGRQDQHYAAGEDVPEAALRASLGCGNPVAVADLRAGETVLDLGSGGGLDVLLSARRVGPAGHVYGLDASPDMLTLARANAAKATHAGEERGSVEFLHGHIESVPLPDGHVDVIISNCVVNLSSDKPAVLAEAFRVLRPGGRLGITDIISDQNALDPASEEAAGCAAGTITVADYYDALLTAGFSTAQIIPTHEVAKGLHSAIVKAGKPIAPDGVTIRPMRPADRDQVLEIYQAALDEGGASFETRAPGWPEFDATKLPLHRYVAADAACGRILGWIAGIAVSKREVYAGVVEHSVYVHNDARGRGVGLALLKAFAESTETAGIWTIRSGIFPENTASLRLHAKAGFRTVGTHARLGRHHDGWRDVVLIERRSTTAGKG